MMAAVLWDRLHWYLKWEMTSKVQQKIFMFRYSHKAPVTELQMGIYAQQNILPDSYLRKGAAVERVAGLLKRFLECDAVRSCGHSAWQRRRKRQYMSQHVLQPKWQNRLSFPSTMINMSVFPPGSDQHNNILSVPSNATTIAKSVHKSDLWSALSG